MAGSNCSAQSEASKSPILNSVNHWSLWKTFTGKVVQNLTLRTLLASEKIRSQSKQVKIKTAIRNRSTITAMTIATGALTMLEELDPGLSWRALAGAASKKIRDAYSR